MLRMAVWVRVTTLDVPTVYLPQNLNSILIDVAVSSFSVSIVLGVQTCPCCCFGCRCSFGDVELVPLLFVRVCLPQNQSSIQVFHYFLVHRFVTLSKNLILLPHAVVWI